MATDNHSSRNEFVKNAFFRRNIMCEGEQLYCQTIDKLFSVFSFILYNILVHIYECQKKGFSNFLTSTFDWKNVTIEIKKSNFTFVLAAIS